MRKAPASGLPQGFKLTDNTLEFLSREFPVVDVESTLSVFVDKAEADGWLYTNWQAAFRNYVRNGERYGGVIYKTGREQDPQWKPVLNEASQYGFRAPQSHETPGSYRTDFELWKKSQKRCAPVIEFGSALKQMQK